jgi:hypothetical protein
MQATTQYFRKRFLNKKILNFHSPSTFYAIHLGVNLPVPHVKCPVFGIYGHRYHKRLFTWAQSQHPESASRLRSVPVSHWCQSMWIRIRKTELKQAIQSINQTKHHLPINPTIFRTGRKYLSRVGTTWKQSILSWCGVQNKGIGAGFYVLTIRNFFPCTLVGAYFCMRLLLLTIFKRYYESQMPACALADFTWQNKYGIRAISSILVRHRFDTDPDPTFHFDAECRSRSHPTKFFLCWKIWHFSFLLPYSKEC